MVNSENSVLRTYSPGVTSVSSDCRSTQDSHGKTSLEDVAILSCVDMSILVRSKGRYDELELPIVYLHSISLRLGTETC
jgi:hypothetical protein